MKKIMDNDTYPANVLSAVFGEPADGYIFYFDPDEVDRALGGIMNEFVDADRAAFYLLYKDGATEREIAEKLQCSVKTVNYMQARILHRLSCPEQVKRLSAFTAKVGACDDTTRPIGELASALTVENNTAAIVENGDIKAVLLDTDTYDKLKQAAAIVERWESDVRRAVRAEWDIFKKAVRLAIDRGAVSTMLLQQSLGIGYAHAGRIIDQMEEHRFISPHVLGQNREVYITNDMYYELFDE